MLVFLQEKFQFVHKTMSIQKRKASQSSLHVVSDQKIENCKVTEVKIPFSMSIDANPQVLYQFPLSKRKKIKFLKAEISAMEIRSKSWLVLASVRVLKCRKCFPNCFHVAQKPVCKLATLEVMFNLSAVFGIVFVSLRETQSLNKSSSKMNAEPGCYYAFSSQ